MNQSHALGILVTKGQQHVIAIISCSLDSFNGTEWLSSHSHETFTFTDKLNALRSGDFNLFLHRLQSYALRAYFCFETCSRLQAEDLKQSRRNDRTAVGINE